jgi:hypothetical protein
MKRLVLALALSALIAPAAFAKPKDKYKDKDWISASEMVRTGFAAAGLICVGTFLVLRGRRARSQPS